MCPAQRHRLTYFPHCRCLSVNSQSRRSIDSPLPAEWMLRGQLESWEIGCTDLVSAGTGLRGQVRADHINSLCVQSLQLINVYWTELCMRWPPVHWAHGDKQGIDDCPQRFTHSGDTYSEQTTKQTVQIFRHNNLTGCMESGFFRESYE